ncbi:Uma2 family endonuclease [Sorangium sp. So ce327]|jgi:Uma2 family endonuclease|uniref:Uma2 family endonuclease n=1 Tax=Sorangium sp. So ce327 TaxID=3133301 RepID=UPI003F62A292
MSGATSSRRLATSDDLLAIPERERFHEVIGGELVRKAMSSGPHGRAQLRIGSRISGPYDRRPGGRWPGGLWFATEVEVEMETHEVYRPDVTGWLRERLPELPREVPIRVRPDWVCEVLSPSNSRNDLFKKLRTYQRCKVPHYWIVDPETETLMVYRWTTEGYLLVLAAEREDRVRPEPFDAIVLKVGTLFDEDDEDEDEDEKERQR